MTSFKTLNKRIFNEAFRKAFQEILTNANQTNSHEPLEMHWHRFSARCVLPNLLKDIFVNFQFRQSTNVRIGF